MGGNALLTLVPRRTYDFSGLANNGSIEFPVAKDVPVQAWSAGVVLVRVHAITLADFTFVKISVQSSLPSPEDPDHDFTRPTLLTGFTLASTAPLLRTAPLDLDLAGFITVLVQGGRKTTPGTISATLSIDLVARSSN